MQTLRGIPVSSGYVVGRIFIIEDQGTLRVKRQEIDVANIPAELERFEFARMASISELNDPAILNPIKKAIQEDQDNAEYAISKTFATVSKKFASHPDSTFQSKVDDLRDLATRLLKDLDTDKEITITNLDEGTVIVARDLTPSQTAGFDRSKVAAFVTALGGPTSHTAIVAGALNLPAVVGIRGLLRQVTDGQRIIVDGSKGLIILDPDEETIERYHQAQLRARQVSLSLHEYAKLPAITADGVPISLLGNIEFAEEIDQVIDDGGIGIGLYRTEFLFLTRRTQPTEEDHYQAYKECVKQLDGKPLTIRTIDLGADKYTQEQEENPERNPYLGLRSIRYCLAHQDIFRTQLRAILRASAHGPIKVMFPLITNIAEFRTGKYFIHEEMEELDEQGIAYDKDIDIGMMVEVPAAALMAGAFAREVDFFSIGTNDLVQYTLAVDRTNERVASLYTPIHPAVLKLIRDVARAGRRYDIPVSCCGQSAADPAFAALLLGLGVRTISATGSSLPMLKKTIRSLTVARCERIAKKAISFDSEAEAASYVRSRLRKLVPEVFDGRPVG